MKPVRKTVAATALAAAALTGGAVGASFIGTASAQTDPSTTEAPATTEAPSTTEAPDTTTETKGPHTANGVTDPAQSYAGDGYDLVTMFDFLHDMGDPASAARQVLGSLKPDATWMIVDGRLAVAMRTDAGILHFEPAP